MQQGEDGMVGVGRSSFLTPPAPQNKIIYRPRPRHLDSTLPDRIFFSSYKSRSRRLAGAAGARVPLPLEAGGFSEDPKRCGSPVALCRYRGYNAGAARAQPLAKGSSSPSRSVCFA